MGNYVQRAPKYGKDSFLTYKTFFESTSSVFRQEMCRVVGVDEKAQQYNIRFQIDGLHEQDWVTVPWEALEKYNEDTHAKETATSPDPDEKIHVDPGSNVSEEDWEDSDGDEGAWGDDDNLLHTGDIINSSHRRRRL